MSHTIDAGQRSAVARHSFFLERAKTHPLSAIVFERGYDIDALLKDVCEAGVKEGLRIGGLIQETRGGVGGCAQSVHVIDIRTGQKFDIWEDRGKCARGCRLDEGALNISAQIIDTAIADKVDLLIINRFGRAESLGRGLLSHFASALEANIPTLTSVRAPYIQPWQEFHGGLGVEMKATSERLLLNTEQPAPLHHS